MDIEKRKAIDQGRQALEGLGVKARSLAFMDRTEATSSPYRLQLDIEVRKVPANRRQALEKKIEKAELAFTIFFEATSSGKALQLDIEKRKAIDQDRSDLEPLSPVAGQRRNAD